MKSFFRICVVLSTVLVLGTSHPQNQRPATNREWRNQEIPQNRPLQWSNQQSVPLSSGPEPVNYQRVHQYPIEVNSFAPINEATQEHRPSHTHRIRKISMPLKDINKKEGTRVIHLPPNGNPKDLKIMLIGNDNRTVYEENNVPESVKEILARALAVNRGEARIIHSESPVNEQPVYEPVNAQPVNAQTVNVQSVNDQSVNAQPINDQLINAQPINAQSVYAQPDNAQTVSAQSVNAQPITAQSVNAQPINGQLINEQLVNAQPITDQPINAQSANAQSINSKSANTQPINSQPLNAQPVNAQPINAQAVGNSASRPLARSRPRFRLPGSNGPLYPAIPGPYRRRRPFQRNPFIRGPVRRPDKILVTSDKSKAATVANNAGAVLRPDGVIPKNANIKTPTTVIKPENDKFTATGGQPKVVSESIDKKTTIISGQDHNINIQPAIDNVKSTTPAPADKYVDDYLHIASKPNQPARKPDTPKEFDSPNDLPENIILSRLTPVSSVIDGLSIRPIVPTPKAPAQPALHDYVPTIQSDDDDYLNPIASDKSDDVIASPKLVPTTDGDISTIILQTKENKMTPVPTLSDGIIPIDTKLGTIRQDDEPSIVASKTTLTESTLLSIHAIDNDDVPIDVSTTIVSTTVTEPTPISTVPNGDDNFLFATNLLQSLLTTDNEYSSITPATTTVKSPLLPNSNEDDDVPIATKLSKTLFTVTDDLASTTIISTTVTEPTPIPINPNDDDSFLLTTDNDDSSNVLSTTAPELTTVSTDINNNDDNKSDNFSSTSEPLPNLASTNQGISKLSHTVTKSNLAPIKSLTMDNLLKTSDGLHVDTLSRFDIGELSDEVKQNNYPYVIISRLPPDDNTTTETSLFTTLIDYFNGNKEMNVPKTGVKDLSDLKHKSDENPENNQEKLAVKDTTKNYEVSPITDTLDNMAKAKTVETLANLKEAGFLGQEERTKIKANEKEKNITIEDDKTVTADDSEENTITSADVANLYEKGPMTPITFVVSLVRSALKGADSLRALFSDRRVKEFLLGFFHV